MTYELAEKLKNAGFPVRICRECSGTGEDNGWNFMNFGRCPSCDRKGFYRPTLSELIEACGNEFGGLLPPTTRNGNRSKWQAGGFVYWDMEEMDGEVGEGLTPEEAVAMLYISLQKEKGKL